MSKWKRLVAAILIGVAGLTVVGCESDFEFPEVEFGG